MADVACSDLSRLGFCAEELDQKFIRSFVYVQIFSVIFLEKIALHVAGGEVQLVLPIFFISLMILATKVPIYMDHLRLVAFALFVSTALFGHIFLAEYSMSSMLLVFVCYGGMCFYAKVDRTSYIRCLRFYNTCVMIICVLTVYQVVAQYTIGIQYWVNLDSIIPESLQFTGYNYLQPVRWMSPYFKPNAIFMLEVSQISQFSAIALMVEIAFFRRPVFTVLYAVAIMLTFSGTGILVLAFCLPVLATRLSPRLVVMSVLSLGGALLAAWLIGWSDEVGSRIFEFSTPGTSGYYRFTIPALLFAQLILDPSYFFSGAGAGTTPKGTVYLLLPFAKVLSEYGILTFFSFYSFLLVAVFRNSPSWIVSYAVFVLYNLAGSTFALPMSVIILIMLSTFFRIAPPSPDFIERGRKAPLV